MRGEQLVFFFIHEEKINYLVLPKGLTEILSK